MIFLKLILLGVIIYVSSDQQASSEANSKNPSSLNRVSAKDASSLINLAETPRPLFRNQMHNCVYSNGILFGSRMNVLEKSQYLLVRPTARAFMQMPGMSLSCW